MFEVQRQRRPRHVRVWLDDLPESAYPIAMTVRITIPAAAPPREHGTEVAIEWETPSCGPSSYGLLGAHFTPATTGPLAVDVVVSPPEPMVFDRPDALRRRAGLPMEYARKVQRTVQSSETAPSLGPGVLRFDRALDDPVGSSQLVFGWLAEAIVRILAHSGEPLTQGTLESLLDFKP